MPLLRVALLLGVLLGPTAGAQPPADTMLSGESLHEDLRVLRHALEVVHPGLYRYNTRESIDRRFAALDERLSRGAPLADSYRAIAAFVSTIECGHTYLNPLNQSAVVAERVFLRSPLIPFAFRWLDGRMVVIRDASAHGDFPAGTEIESINGMASTEVLAALMPYARADGGNVARRVASLEVPAGTTRTTFDIYFPLVVPPPAGPWRFRVRRPDGLTGTVTSPPIALATRSAVADDLAHVGSDSTRLPWQLRMEDDGLAVLAMPTWVTYNTRWDWRGFVDHVFTELAGRPVRALVIDLRGNEGGTNVGDAIVAHLVDRTHTTSQFQRFTRYRRLPADLRGPLETWDRGFDDWGAAAVPSPERPGFFHLARSADDSAGSVVRPVSPRFGGRVFVLVGPDNASATFQFALTMKQQHLGTLVGQPTGGNQRGINGGAFYFLRLPNSHIEVDLPIIGYFPDDTPPNAGVEPDIPVRNTPADVARGRDREMEAVRIALFHPRESR